MEGWSRALKIPDATIERIALYSRQLENLLEMGDLVISSEKLAALCKVNSAQVRKDLSYFGEFGVRGVGYVVRDLLLAIKKILVSEREWRLGIAGLGNLGMALVQHDNFLKRGYRFVAAFDSDPKKTGKRLPNGLIIQPVTAMMQTSKDLDIEIGVIAVPPSQSQRVADMFIESGIEAILNFSPIQVRKPDCCLVQNVDFSVNLDNLAYHLSNIR